MLGLARLAESPHTGAYAKAGRSQAEPTALGMRR